MRFFPLILIIFLLGECQASFSEDDRARALWLIQESSDVIANLNSVPPHEFYNMKRQQLEIARVLVKPLITPEDLFPISSADFSLLQEVFRNTAFLVHIQATVPKLFVFFPEYWNTFTLLQQFHSDFSYLLYEIKNLTSFTTEANQWQSVYTRVVCFLAWAVSTTPPLPYLPLRPEEAAAIRIEISPAHSPWIPARSDQELLERMMLTAEKYATPNSVVQSLWSVLFYELEREIDPVQRASLIKKISFHLIKDPLYLVHLLLTAEPIRGKVRKPAVKLAARAIFHQIVHRLKKRCARPEDKAALPELYRFLGSEDQERAMNLGFIPKYLAQGVTDIEPLRPFSDEEEEKTAVAIIRPARSSRAQQRNEKKLRPAANASTNLVTITPKRSVRPDSWRRLMVEHRETTKFGPLKALVEETGPTLAASISNAVATGFNIRNSPLKGVDAQSTSASKAVTPAIVQADSATAQSTPASSKISPASSPKNLATARSATASSADTLASAQAKSATAQSSATSSKANPARPPKNLTAVSASESAVPESSKLPNAEPSVKYVVIPPGLPLHDSLTPTKDSPSPYVATAQEDEAAKEKKRQANKKKKAKDKERQKRNDLNKKLQNYTREMREDKTYAQAEFSEAAHAAAELLGMLKKNSTPKVDTGIYFEFLYEFSRYLADKKIKILNFKMLYNLAQTHSYDERFYQMRIILELTGLGETDWRLEPLTPKAFAVEAAKIRKEMAGAFKEHRFHTGLNLNIYIDRLHLVAKDMEPGEEMREFLLGAMKLYLDRSSEALVIQHRRVTVSFIPLLKGLGLSAGEIWEAIRQKSKDSQKSYRASEFVVNSLQAADIDHLNNSVVNFEKILAGHGPIAEKKVFSEAEMIEGLKSYISKVTDDFAYRENQNKFRTYILMRLIETEFDKKFFQGEFFRYVFTAFSRSLKKSRNIASELVDRQVWLEILDNYGNRPLFRQQLAEEFNDVSSNFVHLTYIKEILELIRKNILDPIVVRKTRMDKLPLIKLLKDDAQFHPGMIELSNFSNFIHLLILLKMRGIPIDQIMDRAQNKLYSFKSTDEAGLIVILNKLKSKKWPGPTPSDQYLESMANSLLLDSD